MKCEKCIFAIEQEHGCCKCINPWSEWEGSILFKKYDGCREGKACDRISNKRKATNCRQCGVNLPILCSMDICLDCSEKNVKKIFKEYPDIKKAFMESISEMKKELEEMEKDVVE